MTALHPISCRCGKLKGEVDASAHATRAVCYCRDCRAYAYYLGPPEGMLDTLGGTDIVAVRPRNVRFTHGVEHLACMSLTEKGVLRWYASCCQTPVGNTPRDMKISHVGLVHSALSADEKDLSVSFGPVKMHVNRKSARGQPPRNEPLTFLVALVRYLASLFADRITGKYKANPFFLGGTGAPRVEPVVLGEERHRELMRAV